MGVPTYHITIFRNFVTLWVWGSDQLADDCVDCHQWFVDHWLLWAANRWLLNIVFFHLHWRQQRNELSFSWFSLSKIFWWQVFPSLGRLSDDSQIGYFLILEPYWCLLLLILDPWSCIQFHWLYIKRLWLPLLENWSDMEQRFLSGDLSLEYLVGWAFCSIFSRSGFR